MRLLIHLKSFRKINSVLSVPNQPYLSLAGFGKVEIILSSGLKTFFATISITRNNDISQLALTSCWQISDVVCEYEWIASIIYCDLCCTNGPFSVTYLFFSCNTYNQFHLCCCSSGTQKMGVLNQNARSAEKQLETLCFVLYYLNKTNGFR